MYDSGGDGWQGGQWRVFNSTHVNLDYSREGGLLANGTARAGAGPAFAYGALDDGSAQAAWVCLPDGCYEIEVGGGGFHRLARAPRYHDGHL